MASNQNNFIKKMRSEYPQYGDVDDATLAKAYRGKHYADIDEDAFMDKVGLHQPTLTERATPIVKSIIDTIIPDGEPIKSAAQRRSESQANQNQKNVFDNIVDTASAVKDNVGDFFSSTPPSAAEQHKPKPEQADYVNPEAEDWELGKRLVNRTNELTANAIQGTYEFLGNLKTPLNYLGLETQAEQDMNKRRADWFDDASNKLSDFVYENNKLDVKPTHTWDEVKKGFNVGGVFDKDAWQELGNYVLGEGVVSVPDMAEMVATLPMYYASRQQESAEKRAANQGREKPTAEDYALSAPTTIGSIMLDRFGLKGMTEDVVESVGKQALDGSLKEVTATIAKEVKNGTIKEASTEAIQNPLEMFGEEVGTKKGLSSGAEYLDTSLAGAVAGGGMGAGLSGTVATGTELFNSYTQEKRNAQREAFIQDAYNNKMMSGGVEMQYTQAPIDQFTQELDTKIKTIQDQFTNLIINHPEHPIPVEAVDNIDIAEQVVKDAMNSGMNVTDNDGMNAIDKGFKELEAQIGTIEPIANTVQEPIDQPTPIIEKPIIGQPEPEAVVQDSLTTGNDTDVATKRLQELEAIPDDELTVEQQWELEDLKQTPKDNFTGENNANNRKNTNSNITNDSISNNITNSSGDMGQSAGAMQETGVGGGAVVKENLTSDIPTGLISQGDYSIQPITRDATIKYIMKIAKDKGAKGTEIKTQATEFLDTIDFDKVTGLATGYKTTQNEAQLQKNSDTIQQQGVADGQANSTQRDTQQSVPTSPDGASDGQPATVQPAVTTGDDRQARSIDGTSVPNAASELSDSNDGADGQQRVPTPRSERSGSERVHPPVSIEDDNFTIEDDLSEGGLKTKFKNNIEAIKIVKDIQEHDYKPTPADKKTLSKYVGWGGLPNAFEKPDGSIAKGWEKEAKELKAILSPEAYAEARRSTQDAHYTSKEIVDAIWSGVKQLGFKGGKVLEPSVGVGNFFGMMPSSYKALTKLYGVELDGTTAAIAKALYPKATIQNKGFQDIELSNGTFSLAIGNPPFGSQKLFDPKSKHLNDMSIHNYFFAKSMDALEEGGILAMVVSNGLLDASNSSPREYLGKQANLIGAIRLPNNAFSKNANTEVTTDILFLQKRYAGQESNIDQWKDIGEINDTPINQYFVNNPSNLLGQWGKYGTMYRGDMPALIPFEGVENSPKFLLPKAIEALPKNIITHESVMPSDVSSAKFDGDVSKVRVGALFIKDGVIYKRETDKDGEPQIEEIDKKINSKNEEVFYTAKEIEKIKAMIGVVSVADELRRLQIDSGSTDGQIKKSRQELNRAYDLFVKEHGYLNNAANAKLFEEDIRSPFLRALEKNYDKGVSASVAKSTKQLPKKEIAEKSDIFFKRTQTPYERPTKADSVQDALTISLGEYGAINLSYMEALTGKSEAQLISELDGFIYEDVNDGWVTKEEFLSGNVKKKYKEATNEEYKKALLAVFPKDIDAVDISVTLGASWVPKADMEEFITTISGDTKPSANYSTYNAKWVIQANATSANTSKWGTSRRSVKDILEATMNLTQIEVKDNIGTSAAPQWVLNSEETTAAQEKQEQLKEEFKEWIWKSSERRERLGALYNEKFNNKVTRTFDGSHLKFIGKSDAIDLRVHQGNAVWRTMQGGTVLFDHTVGTGKTYTLIASVMELRRIGKSTKPLIVVPNHLTGQWSKEWMELYPNASILVPTERDFEASRRKILMSKIATGDYDGIIIGHSQLSLIENDIDTTMNLFFDEVARIQKSIDMLRSEEGKDARSVKNAERSKETLETKIDKLNDMRRDDNIDFVQLGIDGIFVDEAHEFKNLMYTTGLQGVAGLGNPAGSKKAFDLFIKTQSILDKTGGNNVVFLTGTPISNTIAEMFTMQRYLSYDKLKEDNLDIFDAWVKQYADIKSDWELTPSGKYKLRTRLSKFNNMPELITEYKQFADVVTREDIPSLPIPLVKGGKPLNLVVERSEAQAHYIGIEDEEGKYPEGSLVYRSENLPKGKAKKGDDNMLKIMGEARKVALDMRLINPNAADNPDSKVNVTVKNTIEIHKRWNDKRGTQLIFCDLSTPKGAVAKEKARLEELIRKADNGDEKAIQELDEMNPDDLDALNAPFSVYDDIKAKLIAQGIPEREIAFIHDAATKLQKQELFSKVKGGAVRILIGSTSKMGAGMNVQDRLVALHHIDVPWRPSDLEQREGRIIRQGNLFYQQDPKGFEVEIFRYATKNTLDSMMWQTIEAKANFIEQLRAGNLLDREVDDVSGEAMSAAEMKAMSSGNPLILEDMKLTKDIKKLEALKKNHDRNQFDLEKKIKRAEDMITQSASVLDAYAADEISAQKIPEKFSMSINRKTFDKREDAGSEILSVLEAMAKKEVKEIGSVGDFKIHIEQSGTDLSGAYATVTVSGKQDYDFDFTIAGHSHEGLAQKIMNIIKRIPTERSKYEAQVNNNKDQLPQFKEQIEPFKKADELDSLRGRKKEIIAQLHKKEDDKKQVGEAVQSPAPADSYMKVPSLIVPNTQTKEDNIREHFSRANGYDDAGINYVPPYKVIGLPERSESGEVRIGADIVTLPSVEKPMNADTIRVYLSDIIGNRLYDAKLKGKSKLGVYKQTDSSIRVKNYSDVETMAHEMAHFLDFYFKNPKREATGSFFRKEILKNKEEIKTLSYTTTPKEVLSEGFAEFVRLYLTNYNAVAGLAPNMLKDFEARLATDKELSKKMILLRDGMHQYYYQGATTQNYQGGELNSIAKKIKRSQAQIGKDARQKVIDRIHSIKRIEADVKGDVDNDAMRSPYKALQLVNGHSSIMYSAMNFGVPTVLENGDISYSGKPLNDIFEPATKHGERRLQLLSNYLVARRANELRSQGRENLIPQEAIDNDLRLIETYPEFAVIAEEYQAFNTAMLDFYVSMNHITASQRESFLEFNKNYVPFHRMIESVQNGGVSAGTIGKRLTGGTHSLGNIMENIIDGLESNIKEAMISRGKSMFYEMLEKSGMGGVYATRVATENKMVQVDLEAQAKKIAEIMAQLGLTISKDGMIVSGSMSAEEIYDIKEIEDNLLLNPEAMEFFTHGHPPTYKEGYIDSVIINGKRVYFETKDAGLIDAMTSFKGQNYGVVMSTLMAVKNIMTWNITNNPLFYLTNFARDTVSAGVLSKNGFVPVLNSAKGMYHFITQSKVYKDFMASGGGYGTMRSSLGGDVHAMEMLKVNRGFDVFNKVINAMAYGADVFEYGTRLGEFELAQKTGKSNWQAAFEGREVSTDFAIKGSNSIITGAMATVPFMKAAINGIDKTARRIFSLNGEMKLSNLGKFRNAHGEMIGHKIKFYAAGGMIIAGTLALFFQNKDDERYRRLTRDQKLMYWNIFIGDQHIKIPRPYDIGFVFSALPEIVADLIYTKHGEDALKDFIFGMETMFSIGDISGLFQPIKDHMTNTNWMGSPIIPTQVQNVDDKADQYNDNTALLYKKVGKATGISPILMQHYIDGYLGLTAKMIEETAENILWDKKQWGERPFAQNPIEFLTYRFRGKEEESRTAWSEKYYDLSKRASAVKASYDAKYKKAYLDGGADITEYMSDIDKQAYIGVEDAVSDINSDLGDMKNDLEAVIYSKDYTAKQKEEIINGAYKAKREALQNVVTQLETQLDKIEDK